MSSTIAYPGIAYPGTTYPGTTLYPNYIFRPPTIKMPFGPADDFLWGRVTYDQGVAVLKMDTGAYVQVTMYDPDLGGVVAAYLGGHENFVDFDEAALLTAAGYGAYLQAV